MKREKELETVAPLAWLLTIYTRCPEDLLRRMAAGRPSQRDWHDFDILAATSGVDTASALQSGRCQEMAAGVRSSAPPGKPTPVQLAAQEVLAARRLPAEPGACGQPDMRWLNGCPWVSRRRLAQ
jgi:hypothetical protein